MKIFLEDANERVKNGEVISVPTDTVYGLVVKHDNQEGIEKIYQLKNRPQEKLLILFVSKKEEIRPFISEIPPGADILMDAYWPGALTIIFPTLQGTLGIRIPNCEITLKLLEKTGPLLSTSANISSFPSSKSVDDVEKNFGSEFPILDDNQLPGKIESTVITYKENQWQTLREGAISSDEIKKRLTNFN